MNALQRLIALAASCAATAVFGESLHGASRQTESLDGVWRLSYGPQKAGGPRTPADLPTANWQTVDAAVPGNVELDLMKAGKLPNLAVGNNIYLLRELEYDQWWYQRSFPAPKRTGSERIELVFEGIDCVSAVFLNGKLLGEPRNMFIEHRFDVTDVLRADAANELTVRIDSAVLEGRQHRPDPVEAAFTGNWESLSVRKAPHMYGWDIAPRVVSAGLWRSVRLEHVPATRWTEVYFATLKADASARSAHAMVDWHFQTDDPDIDSWQVRLTLGRDSKKVHQSTRAVVNPHDRAQFDVGSADLWWPRGYGAQPLYDLTLELLDQGGRVLDTWRQSVGLRTVKLVRSDLTTPETPGEFAFLVNGEKIFVKGSNWVPLDSLHSRDKQHLPEAFALVTDLNCNMLRCWGGNVYEDHDFFDLCDRNGVMVWQDFALACAIYPQGDAFAEEIRTEATAVVRKLRNHPSLALWAGNNEIDDAYSDGWFGVRLDPNTDRLSRHVLPEVVRACDPLRDYLPSSPYHSPALVAAGNQSRLKPEDHLWGPRDDFKSKFYTTSPAHFVSETGYHGCPDRESLEQMMEPASVWPWENNEQWLTHAVRPLPNITAYNYRIPLMAKQTAVLFSRVPENLDDFVLASQISQAEAVKFFIELSRCSKWKRTGILWWNVRDCWPIISDAVVDFYGRKKLAYRYIQRVQADVCAMCGEPESGRHPLVVVNDTLAEAAGHVTVRDLDGNNVLFESDFRVGRNGRIVAGAVPQAEKPAMWLLEWSVAGRTYRNHYLAGPRPFKLDDYKRWLKSL